VTFIVDMPTKLANESDVLNPKPEETSEYIRNDTGKMLSRTILLSDLNLPSNLQSINRNQILTQCSDKTDGLMAWIYFVCKRMKQNCSVSAKANFFVDFRVTFYDSE
jgi:hypothetical protein